MTTNAYAAKRAIFERLQEAARTGPLSKLGEGEEPLQVKYDNRPADMQRRCIYGGGVRFNRDRDRTLTDGRRELAAEVAVTTWFIRVAGTSEDEIADLDVLAEQIGEALGELVAAEPRIAGGASHSWLDSGEGNYSHNDVGELVSLLAYDVFTDSVIE